MSKFNSPRIDMARESASGSSRVARAPGHPNLEIRQLLRSADRGFREAIRILDTNHQSEAAGRLHALRVELREFMAAAENIKAEHDGAEFIASRSLQ